MSDCVRSSLDGVMRFQHQDALSGCMVLLVGSTCGFFNTASECLGAR